MMFSAQAAAFMHYTVQADDKEQALDLMFEMIKEDMPDADAYEVGHIIEVK